MHTVHFLILNTLTYKIQIIVHLRISSHKFRHRSIIFTESTTTSNTRPKRLICWTCKYSRYFVRLSRWILNISSDVRRWTLWIFYHECHRELSRYFVGRLAGNCLCILPGLSRWVISLFFRESCDKLHRNFLVSSRLYSWQSIHYIILRRPSYTSDIKKAR